MHRTLHSLLLQYTAGGGGVLSEAREASRLFDSIIFLSKLCVFIINAFCHEKSTHSLPSVLDVFGCLWGPRPPDFFSLLASARSHAVKETFVGLLSPQFPLNLLSASVCTSMAADHLAESVICLGQ